MIKIILINRKIRLSEIVFVPNNNPTAKPNTVRLYSRVLTRLCFVRFLSAFGSYGNYKLNY